MAFHVGPGESMLLARVWVWASGFLPGFMRLRGSQPPQENTPRAHVDKLFDKGWLSFSDDGNVLYANDEIRGLMIQWGLNPDKNVGAFNPGQRKYLAYHREIIY